MTIIRVSGLALAIGILAIPAFSQGRLAELQFRFSKEPDPVRRARLMPALGRAEVQEIQRVAAADDNDARAIGRRENRPGFTGLLRAIVGAGAQARSKEPKI